MWSYRRLEATNYNSANGNTAPVVFWYLFEALKDSDLLDQMMLEVHLCVSEHADINIKDLGEQPLLQSVYAEVLRLRVSILVSRVVECPQIIFEGYTLQRGEYVLLPTDAMHFNEKAWARAGRPVNTPLGEFDAERFLVSGKSCTKFNQDGLAGLWVPFGGGDRMCPGRHLAKLEMLTTFAYLFSNYDIEIKDMDFSKVKCNRRYAAFGALPPTCEVPFRIKRKI